MTIDELREFGLAELTHDEITGFLSSQRVGVLALSGDRGPYVLPISYGYDGDDRLYLTYVLGGSSRKATLTESSETARFLVFTVDSPYSWESVLLTGRLEPVPEERWDDLESVLAEAWRPAVFASATDDQQVRVYEFRIEERTGVKHQGLPPGLDPERAE